MAANADGSIIFDVDIDEKEALKELNGLSKKISSTKQKLSSLREERLPLAEQAKQLGAELDRAKEKLVQMQSVSGTPAESIKYQEETVKSLQSRWDEVQSRVERYDNKIKTAEKTLAQSETRAGELAQKIADAGKGSEKMAQATEKARKKMDVFGKRIASVVRSALIFTVITQALAKFRDWMGRVIKTNDEATKALAKLKGALLTMVQPIVEIIIPAFVKLINIVTKVVTAIARFIAMLTGKTIQQSADAAESLWNEAEALDGVGSAAKEAEKQLASFDEINKLSDTTQNGLGGGGSDTIAPDFGFEDAENKVTDLTLAFERMGDAIRRITNTEVFNIIKDFIVNLIQHGAAGVVNTVASSFEALASACEAVDAVLDGDFGEALFKLLEADLHVLDAILAFPEALYQAIMEFIAKLPIPDWLKVILGLSVNNGMTTGNIGFLQTLEQLGWLRDKIEELKATAFGQWFMTEVLEMEQTAETGTQHVEDEMTGMATVTDEQMQVAGDAVSEFKEHSSRGFSGAANSAESASAKIRAAMDSLIAKVRAAIAAIKEFLSVKSNVGGSGGIGGWGSYDSWAQNSALASAASYTMRNIPALAKGAVIPANREFLAVLGDQKQGTNIEAPLSTIEQALENVMRRRGGAGGSITVIMELDKREFGRAVYEYGNEETQRVGVSLEGAPVGG